MKKKTKKLLLHLGIMLACAVLAVGAVFLVKIIFTAAEGETNSQNADGYKFLGWLCAMTGLMLVGGVFCHLLMLRANMKVHCAKCGELGWMQNYETIKRTMCSDGVHVSTEKVRINMKCPACGNQFSLKKKFTVTGVRQTRYVCHNLGEMINSYARGEAWF